MFCNDRQYVVAVKVQILDAQNLPNFVDILVDNRAKIYEKKIKFKPSPDWIRENRRHFVLFFDT